MSVIPLTLFFSLLLAGLFMFLFGRDQKRRRFASAESDSLLPLADEQPRPMPIEPQEERDLRARLDDVAHSSPASAPAADRTAAADSAGHDHDDHAEHDHHAHDHAHGSNCGCKRGVRPPCVGCLKRPARPALLSS